MENFEVLKPFGPSIVKIKMPNKMIEEINEYVDKVIQDENKMKDLNEGDKLIGKVQQEFLMEINFMKQIKWAEFLASNVSNWAKMELNKEIRNFQLIKSWVVRQFKNDYNPVHWHTGSDHANLSVKRSAANFRRVNDKPPRRPSTPCHPRVQPQIRLAACVSSQQRQARHRVTCFDAPAPKQDEFAVVNRQLCTDVQGSPQRCPAARSQSTAATSESDLLDALHFSTSPERQRVPQPKCRTN